MSKRSVFLNNVPVEQALARFLEALGPTVKPECETIDVTGALDRLTGAPVFALCNSPLYDSAAMDGIAVVSARTHGASEAAPVVLHHGADFEPVDTGDPIHPPYDAVIMVEDIQEDEGGVLIRSAAQVWQHVRPVGEDIVQGEMILPGGHRIRPIDIGVLLSGGISRIAVRRRPRVAIIPTGTELIEPGAPMKPGGIIESNSRMFEALARQGGGEPTRLMTVPDEYDLLKQTVGQAAQQYDMVLVCSGTSAGREDFSVHVLRELGEVVVHGVAMKPGKPVILAVVDGKPVIGVPGYPVSAYLAYENFAAPVLRALVGDARDGAAPTVRATLTRRLVSSLKHREYVRVKVGRVGGRLVASPLARGAGAAMSLVRADGFCVIDRDSEGVEAGSEVDVMLCRDPDELEHTLVCIGSHDLLLDVLADLMHGLHPGTRLSSAHVGSMGGLMALKNGEAHVAPIHLLDPDSGIYNIPILRKLFSGRPMALIKGVGRVQGIMVKQGNPLGIAGVPDLHKGRFVNRQRGAGTRLLLDYLLGKQGIEPSAIAGYDREAATHMAVAAAVRGESADAGMGILSAARAMELDFIPVGNEEYDFAIPVEFLALPHVRAFIGALKSPEFRQKLEELGGYDAGRCGEVIEVGC